MAFTTTEMELSVADPLETLEVAARASNMEAQRVDDTELHVSLTGSWRDIGIWFAWRTEAQVVQLAAPLEMRVPAEHETEVMRLMVMINERLWLGHFDLWEQDKGLVYRNGAVLPDGQGMDETQADILLRSAMDAFERFYPAFNYVIWGQKNAEEALEAAICETAGSA